MMPDNVGLKRYHGLDLLRSITVITTLLVHGAIPFCRIQFPHWIIYEIDSSWLYDAIMSGLHSFRMQLLFILSGFFSAMIMEKYGWKLFIAHRGRRLILPYMASLIIMTPVMIREYMWAGYLENPWSHDSRFHLFSYPIFHLWFLEILIIVTIAACILHLIQHKLIDFRDIFIKGRINIECKLTIIWDWVFYTVSTLLIIWLSWSELPGNQFIDSYTLMQSKEKILYYFIFFLVGWRLFFQERFFRESIVRSSRNIVIGIFFLVVLLASRYFLYIGMTEYKKIAVLIGNLSGACCSFYLSIGLFGAFSRESLRLPEALSFFGEFSYAIYLVHLPVMFLFQVLIRSSDLDSWLKYMLTLMATLFVTLSICLFYKAAKLFLQRFSRVVWGIQ